MTQVYRKTIRHGHRSADAQGHVLEHILVAERALGKPLPEGVHVHHVDGNGLNNLHCNLVICQNAAYHKLLHVRASIVKAGGDPNTDKLCADCERVRPLGAFNLRRGSTGLGRQSVCRECQGRRWRARPRSIA